MVHAEARREPTGPRPPPPESRTIRGCIPAGVYPPVTASGQGRFMLATMIPIRAYGIVAVVGYSYRPLRRGARARPPADTRHLIAANHAPRCCYAFAARTTKAVSAGSCINVRGTSEKSSADLVRIASGGVVVCCELFEWLNPAGRVTEVSGRARSGKSLLLRPETSCREVGTSGTFLAGGQGGISGSLRFSLE